MFTTKGGQMPEEVANQGVGQGFFGQHQRPLDQPFGY
jgi:hypothetical protein